MRSPRGTQFRQWATTRLSEYLVKGFTMDDERLKNPPGKGHVTVAKNYLRKGEIGELNPGRTGLSRRCLWAIHTLGPNPSVSG